MKRISIIGDGGFGLAWALILAWAGHAVTVWTTLERSLRYEAQGYCDKYDWLKQYSIPANLKFKPLVYPPADFVEGELVLLAPPTNKLLEVIDDAVRPRFGLPTHCGGVVTLVKGLYGGTTPNSLLKNCFPGVKSAHITGAAFSRDLVAAVKSALPMHMVVASEHHDLLKQLDVLLQPTSIKPVWSHDPGSVQLAFAMRPVVSFMQGLAAGYMNQHEQYSLLKPIVQAKMMIEGHQIALALGAVPETLMYAPLSAVLAADHSLCISDDSRNFAGGRDAGRGGERPTGSSDRGVVEAVNTILHIHTELCMKLSADADEAQRKLLSFYPYFAETHAYLFWGKPLDDCVQAILGRVAERYHVPE